MAYNTIIYLVSLLKKTYHYVGGTFTLMIQRKNRVGSAAIMDRVCLTERLPDEASILSAELRAILITIHKSIINLSFAPIQYPASKQLAIYNWTKVLF